MEQNDTKKIVRRTVGLLLVLGLLAALTLGLLRFFGNPFEKSKAAKAVAAYVAQTYPGESWEIGKAKWSFSARNFRSVIEVPADADRHFTVTVENGQVTGDSFEVDIAQKGNTIRRLESEYTALAKEAVEKTDWAGNFDLKAHLDLPMAENLRLGQPFVLGELSYSLMLEGTGETFSLDETASLLQQAQAAMDAMEYPFSSYGIQLEKDGGTIAVAQVSPGQIISGNLAHMLEIALADQGASNGIFVQIREPALGESSQSGQESDI